MNNSNVQGAAMNELLILLIIIAAGILVFIVWKIVRNPFSYPYYVYQFDVSGKRNVKIEDYIDTFLCYRQNCDELWRHEQYIQQWKLECEYYLRDCIMKKHRANQYRNVLDDDRAYHFQTVREQTRYRQHNHVKYPYKVTMIDCEWCVGWNWLAQRYGQLSSIGFQSTLNDYHSKNQRKLMTLALRRKIMMRDNYTCQYCGKFMPDEVGLHIDHIIPVSKGGKSVPSNLHVLCSKCNGSKGAKI